MALLSHENKRDGVAFLKMLSPIFFILFVTWHFHKFVIEAIEANIAINSGIILASLYGVVLILIRLRSAQNDFRVIERFGKEAREGRPMVELLEEPWLKSIYVHNYLEHIANTGGTLASQIDQNAIENELHALQDEYNNRMELPQFLVGFMIAMGLLGTFIGLLETLTGISGMLDGMGAPGTDVQQQFGKLVVELRKPLAGMGIAFSASMFGLVTSLMLAVMMINLRRYVGRVISLARNVFHDLTEIAAHSRVAQVPGAVSAKVDTLSSSISNSTIAGRFDLLTRKIEALLEAFESSIGNTQRMVDLMAFGPRMKEISERTLDEIKGQSAISSEQQKTLQNLIEIYTENVKTTRYMVELQEQVKTNNEETLQTIKSLAAADIFFSQRRDQEFRDRLFTDIKSMITAQGDQKKLVQALIDLSTNSVRGLDNVVQVQKDAKNEIERHFNRMIEGIQKVEEVDVSGARHLYEIKERLNKLSNNMGVVDIIASGISGQNVLLEALVEHVRGPEEKAENPEETQTDNPGNEEDNFGPL